jgi:hypothetical protein
LAGGEGGSVNIIEQKTIRVQIFIAGELADAKRICREFCMEGLCVTLHAAEYVYTGGAESGVVVGLINYPRFPADEETLMETAARLGEALMVGLCQMSFSVVGPTRTVWYSRRES